MHPVRSILLAFCAALTLAPAAQADRFRERDYWGPPRVVIDDGRDVYRYDYRDGRCGFHYAYHYGSGRVDREQDGDCSRIDRFPRFNPPKMRPVREVIVRERPRPRQEVFCDLGLSPAGIGLGALGGALLGRSLGGDGAPVIAGALLGGILGNDIGRRMDDDDRRCIGRTFEYGDEGRVVTLRRPNRDLAYDIRPRGWTREHCREFDMRSAGGNWRSGVACRRGNGWEIVSLD